MTTTDPRVEMLTDMLDKHAAKHLPDDASAQMKAAASAYLAATMISQEATKVAKGVRASDPDATPEGVARIIENMAASILSAAESIVRSTETNDRLRAKVAELTAKLAEGSAA